MAARGNLAKTDVINRIALAFGNDFIGEVDKKIYVWGKEGNEKIQIALALTCPKTEVSVPGRSTTEDVTGHDWGAAQSAPAPDPVVTQDEIANIKNLIEKFNL